MKKFILALVAAVALSGLATTAQAYPYWGYGYYQPYGYRIPYCAYYGGPVYRPYWRNQYASPYGYANSYPPYGAYYSGYAPSGPVFYGPRYGYRTWAY